MSSYYAGKGDQVAGSHSLQQSVNGENNQLSANLSFHSSSNNDNWTAEFLALILQIREMVEAANLPKSVEQDTISCLDTAKIAAEKNNKELLGFSFGEAVEILEQANTATETGRKLWDNIRPLLTQAAKGIGIVLGSL